MLLSYIDELIMDALNMKTEGLPLLHRFIANLCFPLLEEIPR